jgi:two-component system response regulator LytT
MNVLIAEDERLAAERLEELLHACKPGARVVDTYDSVRDVVAFFNSRRKADLLLLDIQLADGNCFEIFNKISLDIPVIFTTAYDEFALQAFKFHCIDYLLKPVKQSDLANALQKFDKMTGPRVLQPQELKLLKDMIFPAYKPYKERFIIKAGNKLQYRASKDVSYFFADNKEAYLVCSKDNRHYIIDHTLEELEGLLDPNCFFRISRKFIINIDNICEVNGLISSKLRVRLLPPASHELMVSRERAQAFKSWLDH